MDNKIHQDQYAEAKELIQKWVDKRGHERCWYYPQIFEALTALFEIRQTLASGLPKRSEFEVGCSCYQSDEDGSGK